MPYTVTVAHNEAIVDTLDEARDAAKDWVELTYDSDDFDPDTWTYPNQYFEAIEELTEEGGAIGPIGSPDGTVIKVTKGGKPPPAPNADGLVRCPVCKGKGHQGPDEDFEPCWWCHGAGIVENDTVTRSMRGEK